jgi:hypothetical protein
VIGLNNKKKESTTPKPGKNQVKSDETSLIHSLYGMKKKTNKKFENEEESQKKFYDPVD